MKVTEIPPHTLITGVAAIAWLGSFVIRAFVPDFALGAAADALMTTVVGYWFTAEKRGQKDGSGLLEEVVSKVAVPMIATAHTTTPVTAPAPVATATPQVAYRPPPPPPSPPKSQGGLPWG